MSENQLYLDNMRIYFIRIPKYIIALLSVFLFNACNGQSKIERTTHLKKYNLKGKVKLLSEDLCGALIDLEDNISILKTCVTPKDLGNPYKMEFNKQGYLTLHKYYAGSNFWRDYYEYENDSTLISKKVTYRQLVENKYEWWVQNHYKYDKYGRVASIGYNYLLKDKYPTDEIDFEYDEKENGDKVNNKSYYYKVQEDEVKGIDSTASFSFKSINTYKNTLLISQQFTNTDKSVLTFDDKGEVNDTHNGEFIQGMDWEGRVFTIGDKTIYEYNHLGHRTAITTVSAYGDSSTNSYTYYPNGNLKSSIYRGIEGNVYTTEKFNEEGYKTYYKSPFGPYYDYKYTERDDNGNWVTCQVNKNGRIYYFITREIEYYQD